VANEAGGEVIFLLLQLALPNAMTPGLIRGLTQEQICTTKWGADRRHVTPAMRQEVLRRYRLDHIDTRGKGVCCEIDHKVPRELGGADDPSNLWPQPWVEAALKDAEENFYHRAVCAGTMTLFAAQYHFMHWGEE
jgi:hypothetical protein